jgi:glycosyltransferase involved in cell wall biosynthesis
VIYNPFDYERVFQWVQPITDEPWANSTQLKIGLFGTLDPWKGHELFIEAARRLAASGANLRFLVVGGEPLSTKGRSRELRRLAHQVGLQDRIHFLGARRDVYRVMKSVDILVHCSISPEPFGNVIVEGMLLGRAVVAAAEGGPLEIVTHGFDGMLVEPRSPTALTCALRTLVTDETMRQTLAQNAVRSARTRFSQDVFAAHIVEFYERVALSDRPPFPPRSFAGPPPTADD